MDQNKIKKYEYTARKAYQHADAPIGYEENRFSGFLGRYRYARQMRAMSSFLKRIPDGCTFLDCPCGNGRWLPIIADKASKIIALDLSTAMIEYSRDRASHLRAHAYMLRGEAENLPLADNCVDYVFCFALMKHLPIPLQYSIMAEFARVAQKGIIVSFLVLNPITYRIWRLRRIKSYPVIKEELDWMAKPIGLKVVDVINCATPIGLEHLVLFHKL